MGSYLVLYVTYILNCKSKCNPFDSSLSQNLQIKYRYQKVAFWLTKRVVFFYCVMKLPVFSVSLKQLNPISLKRWRQNGGYSMSKFFTYEDRLSLQKQI